MNHPIHPLALFRLSVLGPLASRERLSHGELKECIKTLAKQTYHIPNSNRVHISPKTIERWYYAWLKHGIDGLAPDVRSDKGGSQIAKDIQQAILACKQDNPWRSINSVVKLLEMQGLVSRGQLARSSVHRLLKYHNLSKRTPAAPQNIERRAFEAQYPGDIWYGDVMHGPRIQTKYGLKKVYLVSVMDDASRLICHSAFCLDETALSIEHVLREALLKRGLPKKFIIDNGAAYRAETLQCICARLDIRLIYCRPYEPEGKGKLERWHKTFRDQFLTEIDVANIQGLDELNARLWVWIERIYHQTPHSSLGKEVTPLSRWQRDLLKVTPLGHRASKLDEYFYYRIKRLVKKDGTISYANTLYEVDFTWVGHEVYLVFDPHQNQVKWIESLSYEYLGSIHPLDKISNSQRKRARPDAVNQSSQHPTPKTSLVETAYQKALKQCDVTSSHQPSQEEQ